MFMFCSYHAPVQMSSILWFLSHRTSPTISGKPLAHPNLSCPPKRIRARNQVRQAMLVIEPFDKTGAGDEIRTHDPNLGKVVLYP